VLENAARSALRGCATLISATVKATVAATASRQIEHLRRRVRLLIALTASAITRTPRALNALIL
jgi:hypothetical protein